MKYIGESTPAWTLPSGRKPYDWKNLEEHPVPGPGNYKRDPGDKLVFEQGPKWKIGTEKKGMGLVNMNKVPGPGQYEINSFLARSKSLSPKLGFKHPFISIEERFKNDNQDGNVGPGTYNDHKITKALPKFSFGYKLDEITNGPDAHMKKNVGPGLYSPHYSQVEV